MFFPSSRSSEVVTVALKTPSQLHFRVRTEALEPSQLLQCLNHLLKMAGNAKLMNPSLLQTLCEHAAGNLRLLDEHGQ